MRSPADIFLLGFLGFLGACGLGALHPAIGNPQQEDWGQIFEALEEDTHSKTSAPDAPGDLSIVDRNHHAAIDPSERPKERALHLPGSPGHLLQSPTKSELQELSDWVRWLALLNLPPNVEDNRKWGKQKKVWDGVEVRREGWKLETKRRWKWVNHGTWSRYFIEFVNPAERLKIQVDSLNSQPDGRRFTTSIRVEAPLKVFGRVSQFVHDIQWISISVNADATVQLALDLEVEIRINPLVFPPDVEFRPKATKASVTLKEFEVDRISQVRGDLAEWIGKAMRGTLERKLSGYNDKLVEKINASVAKQQDRLKLSAHEWLQSSWNRSAAEANE